MLPYYLFLGMTPRQFFEDSPYLAVAYRQAHELKREERNQEMWLQGLYAHDAFRSVIEHFSYGLGGCKGAKPKGYMQKPIPITDHEKDTEKERRIQHTMEWVLKGQQ